MTEADLYQQGVPPLPPRYRFRDLIWGDHALVDDERKGRRPRIRKWFSEDEDEVERKKNHRKRARLLEDDDEITERYVICIFCRIYRRKGRFKTSMREQSFRPRARANSGVVSPSGSFDNIPPPPKVRVEFFTNEKSFKERLQLYFIKNQRSSLRIRIFNFIIKVLSCVLYIVRVSTDDPSQETCYPLPFLPNGDPCVNLSYVEVPAEVWRKNETIRWELILWVNREDWLWAIQVTVAIISLIETLLLTYLSYKGNILQQIINTGFILEFINTVPFIITICYPPLRQLFIPVFMNCWLAKSALQNMFNDLHRAMQRSQSAIAQQLMIVSATFFCLVFTCMCGIQHLQRAGNRHMDIFTSLWFVVVTFSTVGYGDVYPDIIPARLFMMVVIGAALILLPTQCEQLAYTWMERQKLGGTYSSHRAQNEKHVVVCATQLHADTIMDFLNEFYAHPKLQDFFVVLLSPCELDPTMRMILQVPIWAQRVIYIQGSALKDSDLSRCRMQDAEACFILAARNCLDRIAAQDQHTILRSWAVKDFAPACPQYVQIFRPENKFHVKFAEHIVCEDEFKYALLANNCLCPGTSTLVTLLLHTSRGQEGQSSSEEWMRLYGKCSGNEIYHIRLGDSQFFGEYDNKSFTYASFHAHRKYGVALVGVQQDHPLASIQLNPGPRHIMKASDICFYMSITKEENSAFILAHPRDDKEGKRESIRRPPSSGNHSKVASMIAGVGAAVLTVKREQSSADNPEDIPLIHLDDTPTQGRSASISQSHLSRQGTVALELQHTRQGSTRSRQSPPHNRLELPQGLTAQHLNKRPSIAPVPAVLEANGIEIQVNSETSESETESIPCIDDDEMPWMTPVPDYVRGFPPVTPYIGTSPTLCHLLREKQNHCCLQLAQACEHCSFKHAKEYNWPNRAIIVAADYASNGLYNFIVPLRSHARPKNTLNPIVLLLERRPDQSFLECICYFPMVYWMIGSIETLDDLLRAGINLADNVVIVNKESSNSTEEDSLADCNTIVAVQTIFRLFPNANIITELSQASNMRFMQFRAKDHYALQLSKLEKVKPNVDIQKEKDRGSHLYYMFRLPFAAGNVFSASMLDTLLYQAFVKDYLITFVRLLLGIDQAVGSGHLSCMKVTKDDLWIRTYGRLYQKLCSTTCEIPIGIYRTQSQIPSDASSTVGRGRCVRSLLNTAFRDSFKHHHSVRMNLPGDSMPTIAMLCKVSLNLMDDEQGSNTPSVEKKEIAQLVKCRMASLGLPLEDYDDVSDKRNTVSYVIINPGYDLKLELDDIIYLIRPSSLSPQASPLIDERKRMKRQEPTGADKETADASQTRMGSPPKIQYDMASEASASNQDLSQREQVESVSSGVNGTIV